MAFPASFAESNAVLSRPEAVREGDCTPLSILRTETDGGIPCVISCFKVTQEELDEITRTGRIWISIMGHTMPPIAVNGCRSTLFRSPSQ